MPRGRPEPAPLVERAGEHRAGEPAAGVRHVVEADVHRDLVALGVRRGSRYECTAELSAKRRRRRRGRRRRRRGVDARGERDAMAAGDRRRGRASTVGRAAVALRAGRSQPRRRPPARRRSRSPRPRGTRRPARSSSRAASRGRPAGRPRTRRRARRRGRCARRPRTLTARLLREHLAKLRLAASARAELAAHARRRRPPGRRATTTASSEQRRAEADERSSSPPRKKPTPLSAFLEPVRIATQRNSASGASLGDDELDRALGAHLGEVLGDARERLRGHHVGHDQPRLSRHEREHAERDDLHGQAHRRASPSGRVARRASRRRGS